MVETPTPMMAQYLGIKADHPDCVLFYRMGDFYELFFDDARAVAAAIDLTLTKRGKHLGEDIPMCGVPAATYETYLQKLIEKGFRVAICEQTEDPAEARKRGAKSVVRREVVRIATPGTLTEDALLDARQTPYLAALASARGELALAWLCLSSGEFRTASVGEERLSAEMARLSPRELLLAERLFEEFAPALAPWRDACIPQPASRFDADGGERLLKDFFGVASLDGFGGLTRAQAAACGALLDYVKLTQKEALPRLDAPTAERDGATMLVDAATRRNLELTQTLSGERKGSLLDVIDRTVTGPGARCLAQWLATPMTSVDAIRTRADAVAFLVQDSGARELIRATLGALPDAERALARICLGRASPRDLAAVGHVLMRAGEIAGSRAWENTPAQIAHRMERLRGHVGLADMLLNALCDELPPFTRDGGFIRSGWHEPLDALASLRDDGRGMILALERELKETTGIGNLKIRHNHLIGYHIEIATKDQAKVPDDFIHRQGLAGALRYTTPRLSELETTLASAAQKALAMEMQLFAQLTSEIKTHAEAIAACARAIAELDALVGLAELAVRERWNRPMVDDSLAFEIVGGRHPVVETSLKRCGEPFVPNDSRLEDEQRLWLLTGPNMAGKSTFLRQNALIAILAQIGSFVPSEAARIGVVDRLFSRVGAADDLARGQSTFMVEMAETAAILRLATDRSLVILDEIGRGTATYDGLSLAWAVVEYLHDVTRARALFATHYHELTELESRLAHLSCHTVKVREWKGEVTFLHEVAKGVADRSYGIHVARIAGVPEPVLARAEELLHRFEAKGNAKALAAPELPLFRFQPAPPPPAPSPTETLLAGIDPDALSPREALDVLYRLKGTRKTVDAA